MPGTTGTPAATASRRGPGLLAHEGDRLAAGADEGETLLLAGPGKVRVLGEEAVAGVDRLGAARLGGLEDPVDRAGRTHPTEQDGTDAWASSASRTCSAARSGSE